MNYKPLRDLVLITLEKTAEAQTDSGIFLPKDRWNDTTSIAVVKACGEAATQFSVGDRVLVNPYAVLDIQGDGDFQLIKERDILADVDS